MKISILYLTYDGLSDPLGRSQILPYLEGLADRGCDIHVISFEKNKNQYQPSSKLQVTPLRYHKSPPVISTLYDLLTLRKAVEKALKNHEISIVHCRSYITSLVGLWAQKKYGIRLVFDMRGFWADERVEGGLWNLRNPLFSWIYRYFKTKEKDFITTSDAVISLTANAKTEIEEHIVPDLPPDKISVIPTCADLDLFNSDTVLPETTAARQQQLGLHEDDFVLLYLGSLGTWYMLKEMLDFYSTLRKEYKKWTRASGEFNRTRFVFLTREQHLLKSALPSYDFDKDEIIMSQCPRQEVPAYISLCHASVFFIKPSFSKKASAATKMGEVMAMGKPVITNAGWGDVERIIHGKNGIFIPEFSQEAYREAVTKLPEMSDNVHDIVATAHKYYSLQRGVDRYLEVYKKLNASRG